MCDFNLVIHVGSAYVMTDREIGRPSMCDYIIVVHTVLTDGPGVIRQVSGFLNVYWGWKCHCGTKYTTEDKKVRYTQSSLRNFLLGLRTHWDLDRVFLDRLLSFLGS